MMNTEEFKKNVQKWIDTNRKSLPLNIDYWDINISERSDGENKIKLLQFGKYNAKSISTSSFYKLQSRIIRIK